MLSTIFSVVQRYSLLTFFLLANALSWWFVPLAGSPLPYGLMLAAIIVLVITEGKAGLKRLFRQATHWRVGWILRGEL